MLNSQEVGKSILICRLKSNLLQKDLSKKTGISTSSLHGYESGKVFPGLYNAMLIADTLGVTLDELVGYKNDKEK